MTSNNLAPRPVNMLRNTGEGSYFRQRFPKVYGAIGGFLGTAPDEFEGSIMDPLTAQVRQGAEYGYPIGAATMVAPFAGGIAAAKGMVTGSRMAQRGVVGLPPVKSLTPVEREAVRLYSDYSGLFKKNLDQELVDKLIKFGDIEPEDLERLPELRKSLSSALSRPITEKAPLYRGADIPGSDGLRVGDIVGGDRGGAGSFSLSEKIAERFANKNAPTIYRIKDPKNLRGLNISGVSEHAVEREIAVHPDTQMMVSNITKVGNKTIVDLAPFSPKRRSRVYRQRNMVCCWRCDRSQPIPASHRTRRHGPF